MAISDETKGLSGDEKLLADAKRRFRIAADAEEEIRKASLEDMKFENGEQWDALVLQQRRAQGRPALTVNRLPGFVHQVTNDQRQNRPAGEVSPVGDGATTETAEVLQGIIRHIETNSAADQAYDSAFQDAVIGGYGYWRITTDYVDEMSFDQEILIKRVQNPFSVYFDPGATEVDYSDAGFGFVTESYMIEDFEEKFPDAKTEGMTWTATGDGWIEKDRVRVAEYFWKEEVQKTIELYSDGEVRIKLSEKEQVANPYNLDPGVVKVGERVTVVPYIKWALITDWTVLKRTDWPGRWIPIIPVLGEDKYIDGKRTLKGLVRDAVDSQRQYNFMISAATEAIALAPKAPYIGTAKMFEGYEREWQTMNTSTRPYLKVNPDPQAPGAFPQRQQAEPPIQGMLAAVAHASDDMKVTTGIYDASLGARSNEVSGRGILERQKQSQSGNFHYVDNLSRSIRHSTRVILDLIPKVYDAQRVVRIINPDGTQGMVSVNGDPNNLPPGVSSVYDLQVGRYDVTVSAGPSYQTKRQEAAATLTQLVASNPEIMKIAGDLVVSSYDFPYAQEIAERVKRTISPQITMDNDDLKKLPPDAQAVVAQLQSQLQQMQGQLQQAQSPIQLKMLELESKERIEFEQMNLDREKLRVQIVVADITAKAASAQAAMDAELALIQQGASQAHEAAMQEVQGQQQQQQPAQESAPAN